MDKQISEPMTGGEMAGQETAIDVSDLDDLADSIDTEYELSQKSCARVIIWGH